MRDNDFIVYNHDRRAFVESIDTRDGDVSYTTDEAHARIFRGESWEEVWAASKYERVPVEVGCQKS